MKAVTFSEFGSPDVLRLTEVEKPIPKANEVLIKTQATTVTSAECMMRRGEPLWGRVIIGFLRPRWQILGMEISGIIEAIGKDVKRFKVGDEIYGFTSFNLGAYAEYTCLPERASMAIKPRNMSFEEAAACVDGATTAWFFLKDKANIQPEQKILINGASGSIGTYAVQLAKYFGADVTGVCSSKNVELVKSLGADAVIDYTQEDFTQHNSSYDIIFDTVGKSSFARCQNALKEKGCYMSTTGLINTALNLWTSFRGGKQVLSGMSIEKNTSLVLLRELIEAGYIKPIIDKHYLLANIVEAHRHVDTGHKRGNVVITVAGNA